MKKGETVLSIAKKLKVNRTDLEEANYLSTRARLAVGQRLVIPRAPALLMATGPENPPPVAQPEPLETPAVLAASTVAPDVASTRPASLTYRVKRGDTLSSIAMLHRTTVSSLKSWNRLCTNSIQPGQRLTIFTGPTATN